MLLASLAMLMTLVLAMPATADYHPTQQAPAAAQAPTASQAMTAPLPTTGGPSLALLAGALLIGGGLVLRGRRS